MTTITENGRPAPEPSHSSLFIWLFAISSIWHYASSGGELLRFSTFYFPIITPLIGLAIVTALIVAMYPNRTWALLAFSAAQTLVILVRFPFVADHLVMELLLNVSILLAFAYLALKRRSLNVRTEEMFEFFSPVGRWLLIVMYFFGTFHKINPGFMSLESSCAIPFTTGFPMVPDAITGHPVIQYAAIYGTLILESLAMVLLLSTRTKYYGMLLGMSFHFLIGISQFGTLAHFSAFALALHTLFLPSTIGQKIRADRLVPEFLKHVSGARLATAVFVLLQILMAVHLLATRQGYGVNSLFAIFGIALMTLVWKYGRMSNADAPYRLRPPLLAFNAVPLIFFLHCTAPYIGLGTGGVLAMFSGLRTEGGISNHYVIREPIPLFHYQDTVIHFESATSVALQELVRQKQGMVMFDFQRHFMHRARLELPMTVTVDGRQIELDSPQAVSGFATEYFTKQSWLERKYMSFRLVDAPQPDQCRH